MNTTFCRSSVLATLGAQSARSGDSAYSATFALSALLLPLALASLLLQPARATTALADQPVFTNTTVPGNMALALSVEFPTAVSVAHTDTTYDVTKTYLGYFDPAKCYLYNYDAVDETRRHFYPAGLATNRTCVAGNDAKWSGNYMNWATMQTVDPFRWALTGGYRARDTATETLLEKAWASGQGGEGNFPSRTDSSTTSIANATPFAWAAFKMRVQGLGNKMRFSQTGDINNAPTAYDPAVAVAGGTVYEVSVRVKVCDTSASAGGLESNCTAFPAGNYKPTGLIQQYANTFRYSAFGYLNDSNILRDGGVLRARQKFVGPDRPVPASTPVSNPLSEWDSNTGVISINPDSADASATAALFGVPVSNSGVLNYLNKFGQITPGSYKTYDPVGELYYAAVRYFKNLGNVPEWTAVPGGTSTATKTTWVDGFPVITNWDDPILYSCQRNFILGIGDVNTHADKNLPGSSTPTGNEPAKPASIVADTSVDTVLATNKVGALHGLGATLGTTNPYNGCCNNNSALMAGLAYDSNTLDIRPDNPSSPQTLGKQTIQTYWLDILEFQTYKADNQYYLAAKYGGFKVPSGYSPYTQATDIPPALWSTTGETVGSGGTTQPRPDNYFVASKPDSMVLGLTRAFASIVAQLRAYTTSFATSLPQTALLGSASYGAQYDSSTWTGEVLANTVAFDATTGTPNLTQVWAFSGKLAGQLTGTGWDTNRRMVTWNTTTGAGTPFRIGNLATAQRAALDTVYRSGDDTADYLNYLRGDPTHEENSSATGSARIYRNRTQKVGDIVGSKVKPVGAPQSPFADAANPGYGSFKSSYSSRTTMLYVGTNAGVLHGIDGSTTGSNAGREVFAYVPSALYLGPNGTPTTDGLVARGDPNFSHKAFVDGPPAVFDIDFDRTPADDNSGRPNGSGSPAWRTLLVGSLGKGGKSYFAIDVTDPAAMTTEANVATKVLWEFSHADLGFTYGEPTAVKTRKYGWVLVFGSGYNNADGQGYFFLVNPRNGRLLQRIATGAGTVANRAGLAHVQSYILDRTDGTADAIYAGDLLGNLWRLDLTGTPVAYPAPVQLAQLTNGTGAAVPVTSRPLVLVHPRLNRRYVVVGSGRLLDSPDIGSTQPQIFAAYMDGNGNAFNSAAALPSGITFPIQRSNLVQHTNLTLPVSVNPATQMGWWVDLGTAAAGNGWRVISDASSFYGIVTFVAMLPNGDACNPSGTSRVYSVDVGTGESQLVDSTGAIIAYSGALPGVVIEHRTYSVNGTPRLIACNDIGQCSPLSRRTPAGLGLRRLNWRELPLAD